MSTNRNHHAFFFIALLMVAALAMTSGCSKSPLGEDESQVAEPQLLTRTASAATGALMTGTPTYTEQIISSADGGTLSVLDVVLTIPPGAVPNDTMFSINIPDPEVFYNEFGTDGLVFQVPVTVTMSFRDADLSGVDVSSLRLAWYNEKTGQFEDLPCVVDLANRLVTAEVNHFSAYGLISDRFINPPM